MSYVVRDARKRSPYWYAVYVAPDGRRLKKSTELTSKSKALEMARMLQKASDEAQNNTLTEARARELVSDLLASVSGEGLRVFTVKQWLEHFVTQKKKSRAAKTAMRHEQMMDEFIEFLGPRAGLNIAGITSKDISDFRDYRERKGLAPATVNLDITILSSAFNAALKQGHVPVNPCAAIEKLKDNAKPKSTFTTEQVAALVNAAKGHWRGLILTAFYTGQRLNDCANLKWANIDLLTKTIRFQVGKTNKQLVTVIHPALENHLLSLPGSDDVEAFVFPSLAVRASSPLSKAFKLLMKEAHIGQTIIRERGKSGRSVNALSFHSLRHSYNSILANAGVTEELRMALTGHVTRDMNRRYTHRELEILRDAVAVLPHIK